MKIELLVQLTNKCNWNCVGCIGNEWHSYSNDNEKMYIEKIYDLADSIGRPRIELGWGCEPTIHPDFKNIYNKFVRSGFNVDVLTNGSQVKRLAGEGFILNKNSELRISVLGGLIPPRSYNNITGKSFRCVVELVEFLNGRGIKPTLAMTQDFNELESLTLMLEMLNGLNFSIRLKRYFPLSDKFLGYNVIEKYIKKEFPNLTYINGELRNSFLSIGFKKCPLFPRFGVVLNGDVLFCCNRTDIVLGNILNEHTSNVATKLRYIVSKWNYDFDNCNDCGNYVNALTNKGDDK